MSSRQDPLSSDQGSTAEVLVEGVDEGHLPAPLARSSVFPADYSAASVGPLHAADVLVGHGVLERRPVDIIEGLKSLKCRCSPHSKRTAVMYLTRAGRFKA